MEAKSGSPSRRLIGALGRWFVTTVVIGASAVLPTVSLPGHAMAAPGDNLIAATPMITSYLSEWTIVNFPDAISTVKYGQLTHCIFTQIGVTPASAGGPSPTLWSGWGISDTKNRMSQVVAAAHPNGCKVLASLYAQPGDGLTEVVQSATMRAELVANLVALVTTYGLDGIDLDWEDQGAYPPDSSTRGLQDILINDLHAALNPLGKVIMVASAWDRQNILAATAAKVEAIQVMTYDMTYTPAAARPPVHSSYQDTVSGMNLWISAGFPRSKLLLGIPAYGEDAAGVAVTWREIVSAIHPTDDQNSANVTSVASATRGTLAVSGGVLWWNGLDMVRQKAAFAVTQNLGGVMLFDAGLDLATNGILQVIHDCLTAVPPNGVVFAGVASGIGANTPVAPFWDINGDHTCSILDLTSVGNHIGQTGTPGWILQDANGDGRASVSI